MSDTIEAAKDDVRDDAKDDAKAVAKKKPVAKDAKSAAPDAKSASETLLKEAIDGKPEAAAAVAPKAAEPLIAKHHARYAAVVAGGLVLGIVFGMIAAPTHQAGDGVAQIAALMESSRAETGRLGAEVERLSKSFASLRDSNEIARSDGRLAGATLTERLAKLEQTLDRRLATVGETIERTAREQAARLTTAVNQEKHLAAAAPAPAAPAAPLAATPPKPDPAQTASIAEKPKAETIETWALRDVYDGIAMLEDRKRRLLEVGRGDAVPGIGRVEAIERRGRMWVVVTKQGLITPQTW